MRKLTDDFANTASVHTQVKITHSPKHTDTDTNTHIYNYTQIYYQGKRVSERVRESVCARANARERERRLTDDLAGRAAGVDVFLPGAELRRKPASDERVQHAVTSVRHHRRVTRELVSLQGCRKRQGSQGVRRRGGER